MKRMSVREFKNSFHRVTEPIEVLNRTTTIGMFYPTGFGHERLYDVGPKGVHDETGQRTYDVVRSSAEIHDAEHHGKMIKGCIYCNGDE